MMKQVTRIPMQYLMIILSLLFCSAASFSLSGSELRDLESNTSYFETEAQAWQLSNRLTSSNASRCGSTWLLGGFGIVGDLGTFTRKYSSLPPHQMISFSLDVWLIDMIELTDLFELYFDGSPVSTWNSKLGLINWSLFTKICGEASIDYGQITLKGHVVHNSSDLTIQIASLFQSNNNFFSFGFRNLNILFRNSSTVQPSVCDFSFQGLKLSSAPSCLCPAGQYDSSVLGGCKSCSSNCKTCTGSSIKDCASCYPGYFFDKTKCSQCDPSCARCNGTSSTDCTECSSTQFLYQNGSCQSSCDTSSYKIRTEGEYQYCEPVCDTNQFLYQNMTCLPTCPSPFIQSSQGNMNYCNFPCSKSEYLYPNGTCISTCDSPYTAIANENESGNYCQQPCSASEYFYANNTCLPTCQPPYVVSTDGNLSYCEFPCTSQDFLYWNGSCLSTCPIAFQSTSGSDKSCSFHCSSSDYLYWNSTCLSTCNTPLVPTTDLGMNKFCNLPCLSGEYLFPDSSCNSSCGYNTSLSPDGVSLCNYPCPSGTYLYANQTCLSNCPTPYIAQIVDPNLKRCSSPCLTNECYMSSQATCVNQCNSTLNMWQNGILMYCEKINITITPSTSNTSSTNSSSLGTLVDIATKGLSAATAVVRSSNPNSAFMIATVKLLKYTKYMQIPVNSDIQQDLSSSDSSVYSIPTLFVIPMPDWLKNQVPGRILQAVFEKQLGQTSYLINHWETMSTYFIFLALGVTCALLEKMSSLVKKKLPKLIFNRLKTITQWNFALFIIFNTYDDLTLYAILEFRNLNLDAFASYVSFGLCLFVTYIALYLLVKVFLISREAVRIKRQILSSTSQTNPTIAFYKKWERYQVLFAGYDNTSFLTQAFLFFYTCRIIITYMIVGLLFEYPLIQTILFLVISCLMLLYLAKKRPIKDFFTMQVCGLFEVLTFIVNVCLFLLVALDDTGNLTTNMQFKISQMILFVNIISDFASNMFMWVFIFYAAKAAYQAGKIHGLSGKTSWLIVLTSPYQNFGQTFHELSNYDILNSENLPLNNKADEETPSKKRRSIRRSVTSSVPFIGMGSFTRESSFKTKPKSKRGSVEAQKNGPMLPKINREEPQKITLDCSHDSKNALDLEANYTNGTSYSALLSPDAQSALLLKRRVVISPQSDLKLRKRKSSFSNASDEKNLQSESTRQENPLERRRSSFSSFYQEVLTPKPKFDVSNGITENFDEASPASGLLKIDLDPTELNFANLVHHVDSETPIANSLKTNQQIKKKLLIRKKESEDSDSPTYPKLLVSDLEDGPKSIMARNSASEVVTSLLTPPTSKDVKRRSLEVKKPEEEEEKNTPKTRKSAIHALFFGSGEDSESQEDRKRNLSKPRRKVRASNAGDDS